MLYRTRFENEMTSLREFQYDVTVTSPVTRHLPIKRNSDILKGKKIGVHVPVAAATAKIFDVIVYFHGFVGGVCKENLDEFNKRGMEYYWKVCWFNRMLGELDASKRAAILIAPTMHHLVGQTGSLANRYDNLNKDGLFDKLIEDVLKQLKAANDIDATANVGNVVLAAHSGGGKPMHDILKAANPMYKSKIRACWGFECLYPDATAWVDWLNSDSKFRFRHFRQEGAKPFKARVESFQGVTNFKDVTLEACWEHCRLLRLYWKTVINLMPAAAGSKDPY